MSSRYKNSEAFLGKAEKIIPLGSQTFSKSKTQLPYGISPYFADRAKGSKFWDIDGNEFIDFVNGLAAITIGYCDDDVDNAVIQQVNKGTIFSLASELEYEVSKKIVDMVPGVEMVRFGKNGSDATSGAVRVARAVTGRDHVLVCGYHGWQDWYIGSTSRNLGVPGVVQQLTHPFSYNDIQSLGELFDKLKDKVACVILEPMNVEFPNEGFLEQVKELTHQNGALLVFDETITGFRMSNGGAQEYFNVIPDLSTFGKGIANGFPLSALGGKEEYMKITEDIFFSFTFGGETLSLAAANTVLDKLKRQPVIDKIWENGNRLKNRLNHEILNSELNNFFKLKGSDVWSFLVIDGKEKFNTMEMKTYFLQHMFENGIYILGTHNLSFSHSEEDIDYLLIVYKKFFEKVKSNNYQITSLLNAEVLEPLFKVR